MTEVLDIDALRVLRAVALQGGVTRAASMLNLSQSAVSHKIRRLEEALGRKLLTRRTGGPFLTDDARRLMIYAERILTLHQEALAGIGVRDVQGTVRLGLTEDTTSAGLAQALSRFARLYPNVAVRSQVDQSLTLQRQIKERALDLAVLQVFEEDIAPLDTVLARDELVWVQGLDAEFSADRPLPFIAFDPNCFFRQWAYEHSVASPYRLNTVLECASIQGVTSAVRAGLGITILNRRYLGPGLKVAPMDLPSPPSVAYIVRAAGTQQSPAVKALRRALTNALDTAPR